jgi:hypothetical protein
MSYLEKKFGKTAIKIYKKKITVHYKTLKANDIDQLSMKTMCIKK